MAARVRCTRRWSRANSRSIASLSRSRRVTSRPTACWSRTCAATSCARCSRGSPMRRSRRSTRCSPRWRRRGRADINAAAPHSVDIVVKHAADMRYIGQEHAVTVEVPGELFARRDTAGIKARFDAVHQVRYGYASADEKAEIVSLRLSVTGVIGKPAQTAARRRQRFDRCGADQRAAGGIWRARRTHRYADLCAREARRRRYASPGLALIQEYASTTVLAPGDTLTVDRLGNLDITVDVHHDNRIDPVTTEIVRNGFIAATEEMKTNLMRTAYNMIIYEALDFTVGLFDRDGQHRFDRPRAADVHPRHERDHQGQDRTFRLRQHPSGRCAADQRRLYDRQPPQSHDVLGADLP